jgi:hypothetical protein
MMLSVGFNRKLAKNIGVFNLPCISTCPGKTTYCNCHCYAKKAERLYPNVVTHRKNNLKLSKQPEFIKKFLAEITISSLTKVRFHESGDAYSQKYLDKIIEITQQTPNVSYLMYTRSHMLDFSKAPKNLVIYFSADSTTKVKANLKLVARIIDRLDQKPAAFHLCMGATAHDQRHYCGSICNHCWDGVSNVAFLKH